MNRSSVFSPKTTFIIAAILLPVMLIATLGSALAGLEGINPENHGKTLVFPIGNDAADIVKMIFGYIIAPFSILLVILAGLNLKFKNALLNKSLLLTSLFFVCWLVFATWALDASFVTLPESPSNSNQLPNDEGLRIRSFDIN